MTESPRLPAADWPDMQPGWVWLCGAGPGDPGLVTLHTLNALRQADAIVHDALVAPEVLALARPGAALIPMGKRGGRASPGQAEVTARLIALARAGKRVLRLKGGDPFVFGRGGEEAEDLVRAGVPIRVVPGVSAGIGGLAYAGIPVTHRDVNSAVIFVTGHDATGTRPPLDWPAIARAAPVIVIYMGMKHLAEIATDLMAAGRPGDEPVAIVMNASTPAQRVLETTLSRADADAAEQGIAAPATICIGRAALLRRTLDWLPAAQGAPA